MPDAQYYRIAGKYSKMMDPVKKHVIIPTFTRLMKAENLLGKTALDLACGNGIYTRILASFRPNDVVGVDISNEMIRIAQESENAQRLGITYIVGDVLSLRLDKKFDVITAVYLLNYARTKKELTRMCAAVRSHIADDGVFYAVVPNPSSGPSDGFEYGIRTTNADGKRSFADGDVVRMEFEGSENGELSFSYCYWSKETYEGCLGSSGFSSIEWVPFSVSEEGIKEYGSAFWDAWLKNPPSVVLACRPSR